VGEIGRACSRKGAKRSACISLLRNLEGKGPLGRPRHKWKDNIEIDSRETGLE
jgi:hypothetical protein